jgi:NAD(P)-dependent dehydrogenase (short-subunit alcohol dehydrogenase family)/aryl carrier-like protein
LFTDLRQRGLTPALIVHAASMETPRATGAAAFEDVQMSGVYDLTALVQAVAGRSELTKAEIIVISSHADAIDARDEVWPERACLQAICRVVPQEYPTLKCRSVDVDGPVAIVSERLAAEILSGAAESVVAYRGAHRWTRSFEAVPLPAPSDPRGPWQNGHVYLVTGGLGKVGLAIAEHVLQHAAATLVLVGRTAPDLDDVSSATASAALHERLSRLRARSANVHVMQGDVADLDRMVAVVNEVRRRFGGLHGVIHAAGALGPDGFAALREPGRTSFTEQFRAKVHGVYALERALTGVAELEFCLLVSSLSAYLGGVAHAAYAAANRFMSAYAASRAGRAGPRWVSVDSELWHFAEPPVARDAASPGLGASLEGLSMSADDATAALDRILLASGISELAVSTTELNGRYKQWAVGEGPTDAPAAEPAVVRVPHRRSGSITPYVAPRGPIEEHLAQAWGDVLGFAQVGVEDDFFRLGGHSIAAIRIVARLRSTLGLEISVVDLLTNPTIARLGAVIAARANTAASAIADGV